MGTGSVTSLSPQRRLTPFARRLRKLSERFVQVQRSIRVLQTIRWDVGVERDFFARGCSALPSVTADYYRTRPLPFEPAHKLIELTSLERDVRGRLGTQSAPAAILLRLCGEFRAVVHMLAYRGTPRFSLLSSMLYGSALPLERWSTGFTRRCAPPEGGTPISSPLPDAVPATIAAKLLAARLARCFPDEPGPRIRLVDTLSADAAAGRGYIKLRRDARFSPSDLRLLEVHEGWVHCGTTLNGQHQPVCTFLAKTSPSATVTQEGLAVATELLAGVFTAGRMRKLCARLRGVALAEQGGNFLDVFRFFVEQGYEPRASYQHAHRIFRGSLPERCGPFTKDVCYLKGFVLVLAHMQRALRSPHWTPPLLFCGKTALADLSLLDEMAKDGLLAAPCHVPPMFADRSALSACLDRGLRTMPPACANILSAIMDAQDQPDGFRSAA